MRIVSHEGSQNRNKIDLANKLRPYQLFLYDDIRHSILTVAHRIARLKHADLYSDSMKPLRMWGKIRK